MGFDDFDFSGRGARVKVTKHARERWRERVPESQLYAHGLDANTWHQAEVVYAPQANCDESRLYQIRGARDMLLCGMYNPDHTSVVTVMHADYSRLRRR
jgi:hypothetical protein